MIIGILHRILSSLSDFLLDSDLPNELVFVKFVFTEWTEFVWDNLLVFGCEDDRARER